MEIMENLGTIIISLLLIAGVCAIMISLRRDKKKGKSCCGGNCSSCHMCSSENENR